MSNRPVDYSKNLELWISASPVAAWDYLKRTGKMKDVPDHQRHRLYDSAYRKTNGIR